MKLLNQIACTVTFWEWISNSTSQFIAYVIIYPCWTFKLIRVGKRGPRLHSDELNVLSLICITNNSGTRTLLDWKHMLFSCSMHVLFDLFWAFDLRANLVICVQ